MFSFSSSKSSESVGSEKKNEDCLMEITALTTEETTLLEELIIKMLGHIGVEILPDDAPGVVFEIIKPEVLWHAWRWQELYENIKRLEEYLIKYHELGIDNFNSYNGLQCTKSMRPMSCFDRNKEYDVPILQYKVIDVCLFIQFLKKGADLYEPKSSAPIKSVIAKLEKLLTSNQLFDIHPAALLKAEVTTKDTSVVHPAAMQPIKWQFFLKRSATKYLPHKIVMDVARSPIIRESRKHRF